MRFLVVATASVVLFFPTFWLFNAVVGPNWGAGIAAVAMYIAFPVLALRAWPAGKAASLVSMEQALARGQLAQETFEVTEAVSVLETEDEGLHFFLAVGADRTLFLSGQYLYEPTENRAFPSTRIRVYWSKETGASYGVECLGESLAPSKRLPALSGDPPADRQLIQQSLSQAVESAA
jgi:hypothetical protein